MENIYAAKFNPDEIYQEMVKNIKESKLYQNADYYESYKGETTLVVGISIPSDILSKVRNIEGLVGLQYLDKIKVLKERLDDEYKKIKCNKYSFNTDFEIKGIKEKLEDSYESEIELYCNYTIIDD